jgi:hypothetical protein
VVIRSGGGSALFGSARARVEWWKKGGGEWGEWEGENGVGHGWYDSRKSCRGLFAGEPPLHASVRPCWASQGRERREREKKQRKMREKREKQVVIWVALPRVVHISKPSFKTAEWPNINSFDSLMVKDTRFCSWMTKIELR